MIVVAATIEPRSWTPHCSVRDASIATWPSTLPMSSGEKRSCACTPEACRTRFIGVLGRRVASDLKYEAAGLVREENNNALPLPVARH